MEKSRLKKGESIIHRLASEYIESYSENEDENFGIITVTDVKISPDMSYADISVSSLFNQSELTKFLAKGAKGLEKIMHKNMQIRKIPKVRFLYDDNGEKMFDVMKAIDEATSTIKSKTGK